MQVNFHPPSELDAHVEAEHTKLCIQPKFYRAKGSTIIGTFQVVDHKQTVLDRAMLSVSANGRISLVHRNEEVAPVADVGNGGKSDGRSARSKSGPGG